MRALLLGLLEGIGLNFRLGLWVALLLAAFYIWRTLKIGRVLSGWLVRVAFALVIIATGLASGVLTGVDTAQLMGIVNAGIGLAVDLAQSAGLLVVTGA